MKEIIPYITSVAMALFVISILGCVYYKDVVGDEKAYDDFNALFTVVGILLIPLSFCTMFICWR